MYAIISNNKITNSSIFHCRFHLLLHEPTHIKIKKTHWSVLLCCICDKYIAGNYHTMRKHKIKEHPEIDDSNVRYTTHICPKCHLKYYNYRKHLKNYHKQYQCEKCLCCFDMSPQKNEHKCETLTNVQRVLNESTTSMMQLCDLCFTFMRVYMQNRLNYEEIGTKSELGVQQTCDKCCNKFFTVKLVKRRPLARPLPCEDNRRKHIVPKVKALSNRERLIKIQNRLKMMKKFNKCWFSFGFLVFFCLWCCLQALMNLLFSGPHFQVGLAFPSYCISCCTLPVTLLILNLHFRGI